MTFANPLVEGLYCQDCPPSQRFSCSASTRRRFLMVVSALRAATTITELMTVPYLKVQWIDISQALLSVQIDAIYELEFSCVEVSGSIHSITIERLRNVAHH